jgi:hypothetical protein
LLSENCHLLAACLRRLDAGESLDQLLAGLDPDDTWLRESLALAGIISTGRYLSPPSHEARRQEFLAYLHAPAAAVWAGRRVPWSAVSLPGFVAALLALFLTATIGTASGLLIAAHPDVLEVLPAALNVARDQVHHQSDSLYVEEGPAVSKQSGVANPPDSPSDDSSGESLVPAGDRSGSPAGIPTPTRTAVPEESAEHRPPTSPALLPTPADPSPTPEAVPTPVSADSPGDPEDPDTGAPGPDAHTGTPSPGSPDNPGRSTPTPTPTPIPTATPDSSAPGGPGPSPDPGNPTPNPNEGDPDPQPGNPDPGGSAPDDPGHPDPTPTTPAPDHPTPGPPSNPGNPDPGHQNPGNPNPGNPNPNPGTQDKGYSSGPDPGGSGPGGPNGKPSSGNPDPNPESRHKEPTDEASADAHPADPGHGSNDNGPQKITPERPERSVRDTNQSEHRKNGKREGVSPGQGGHAS